MPEFIKNHGAKIEEDWVRVNRLYEASMASTKFCAPQPLRLLADKHAIAYQELPVGQRLDQLLADSTYRKSGSLGVLLHAAGGALAELHTSLEPVNTIVLTMDLMKIPGPDHETRNHCQQHLLNVTTAALHGDFGHGNIWVCPSGELWLYDPIPSQFCPNTEAGMAPIYYDLGHMVCCLWAVYPLRNQPLLRRQPHLEWIDAFLKGYQDHSPAKVDRRTVFLVASYILDNYRNSLGQSQNFLKGILYRYLLLRRRQQLISVLSDIDSCA